jgi:hypothetical protein
MMVHRKMIYVTVPLCRKAVLRSTGRRGAQLDYGAIVLTWNLCGSILPSPVVASR